MLLLIICFGLGLIFAAVGIAVSRKPRTARNVVEILLLNVLVFSIGIECLLGFYGHVFQGPEIASRLGWPANTGFQYEVGIMNLMFAVLGIMAIWFRGDFWLAVVVASAVAFYGCGVGHLRDLILHSNLSPYNAGIGIWNQTIIVPTVLLALIYFYRKLKA